MEKFEMNNDGKLKTFLRVAIAGNLFLLILLAGSCSTTTDPNAGLSSNRSNSNNQKADGRVSLFDNRFSFIPPDGFKLLTASEIRRQLPDNTSRENIYSNADQTAYLLIALNSELPVEPSELPEVKRFTEGIHKNYSGWKTSEIIDMNGRQWFHFEYESPAMEEEKNLVAPVPFEADEPEPSSNVNAVKKSPTPQMMKKKQAYVRMYMTSLDKKLLTYNLDADTDKYPQVKEAFDKSLQTIQVKE